VLLLGRHMEHEHVVAGLAAAHRAGALTADAVALEARKAAEGESFTEPAKPTQARPVQPQDETGGTVTFLSDWKPRHPSRAEAQLGSQPSAGPPGQGEPPLAPGHG
jgi:hypothetical protein